jgi:hypothetical protein
MLIEFDAKALAAGIPAYVVAVAFVTETGSLTMDTGIALLDSQWFRSAFWIASTVLICGGGFLAGLIAGRRGILHGVAVALGGAPLAFLYLAFRMPDAADHATLAGYLTTGIVLSALAGGNGELIATRKAQP